MAILMFLNARRGLVVSDSLCQDLIKFPPYEFAKNDMPVSRDLMNDARQSLQTWTKKIIEKGGIEAIPSIVRDLYKQKVSIEDAA